MELGLKYSLTPFTLPERIWEKLKIPLQNYQAVFSPTTPDKDLTTNAIVWTIESRTPGDDGGGGSGSLRSQFVKRVETTDEKISDLYYRTFTVIYRFEIFSSQVGELHDLAWEFEKYFESACDALTTEGYGDLRAAFYYQGDSVLANSYANSNLRYITLKMKVILNVQDLVETMRIQTIGIDMNSLVVDMQNTFNIYTVTEVFEIPVEPAYKVANVESIQYLPPTTGARYIKLVENQDYTLTQDDETIFVTWKPSFLPAVDGKLNISYSLLPRVSTNFLIN